MLGSQHVERCQVLVGHHTVSTLALGKSQDLIPLSSVEQRACVFIIDLCQGLIPVLSWQAELTSEQRLRHTNTHYLCVLFTRVKGLRAMAQPCRNLFAPEDQALKAQPTVKFAYLSG